MGEGCDNDAAIMPFIHSCNIACGGHAGDEASMRRTIELALQHGVAIGAHPSYPDRENFGRVDIEINQTNEELDALQEQLLIQICQLRAIAQEYDVNLSHIKPHGALYNRAAVDPRYAQLIIDMIQIVLKEEPDIVLYGLSDSLLAEKAHKANITFKHEVFADRHYLPEGQLVPRSQVNAVIDDVELITRRTLEMAQHQRIVAINQQVLHLPCDTLCIHGDHPNAAEIARSLYSTLAVSSSAKSQTTQSRPS